MGKYSLTSASVIMTLEQTINVERGSHASDSHSPYSKPYSTITLGVFKFVHVYLWMHVQHGASHCSKLLLLQPITSVHVCL